MRLLFVGQAPSRTSDPGRPFSGKCGEFLARLLGVGQGEMLAAHDFLNVLDEYPGRGINGDKFPLVRARVAALGKLPLLQDRTVVLLGANVAASFRTTGHRYLENFELRHPDDWRQLVTPTAVVVPHPSGVCRWWNSRGNVEAAAATLRALAGT